MKKLILLVFGLQLTLLVAAQDECYYQYVEKFEQRGAFFVEDGMHEDVIITFRKGSRTDCFLGRAKVANGMINKSTIYLKLEDGSYEPVSRKFRNNNPVEIDGGVSETMVALDDELINIFFSDSLKPKKKDYVRAPDPEFDL